MRRSRRWCWWPSPRGCWRGPARVGCGSVSPVSPIRLCTAAAATGQVLLADITAWIAGAGQEELAAYGCRRDVEGRYTSPHPDTVERLLSALEAQQLADRVGAWLADRAGIGPVAAPTAGPGW